MSLIKGGDLMLFVNGKSIAFATNHTLNISADTKETTTKDNGGKWQYSEAGILSWTASSENMLADSGEGTTFDDLFDLMIARTPITAVFTVEGNSTTAKLDNVPTGGWTAKSKTGYTGDVVITSLVQNAPNGENATFTADFTGVGPLTKVPTA